MIILVLRCLQKLIGEGIPVWVCFEVWGGVFVVVFCLF